MEIRLEHRLSQKLVMTPQLQQAIKLLQLNRLELQQVLSQHLDENVLLEDLANDVQDEETIQEEENPERKELESEEAVISDERENKEDPPDFEPSSQEEWENFENDWRPGLLNQVSASDDDLPSYEQTLTKPTSLEEHVEWQMRLSSLEGLDRVIGRSIVGNLDEDGYLRVPLQEIAEDAQAPLEAVEKVLGHIQTFDPPGVGARDLRECLLIQLNHLERDPIGMGNGHHASTNGSLAKAIVSDHLLDLQKKRYANIAKAFNVSVDEVCEAVKVIEGLEPKPGRPYFSDSNTIIIPDVYVMKHEGEWVILLNEDGLPRLRISPYYRRLMTNQTEDPDSTKAYLQEKLRGAQWIIRSIDQRNKTIVKVVTSLVKFQEEFLEKGIQHLRPLVLKQVAEDVEMHESTISRVTTNKYMHCPQGIFELKFFFNAGIPRADNRSEEISSVTVMEMIREMVAQEDASHPLKDQEIVARLRGKGILIARRTVAKYRAELHISSASQRKRISY
ncbi:MAG: RNA polymerase factor sigma-54 [Nitrospirota bacterium]|nr:MAG: RNA polymerase factor sigma-54 [Nitrospirota bacterium]